VSHTQLPVGWLVGHGAQHSTRRHIPTRLSILMIDRVYNRAGYSEREREQNRLGRTLRVGIVCPCPCSCPRCAMMNFKDEPAPPSSVPRRSLSTSSEAAGINHPFIFCSAVGDFKVGRVIRSAAQRTRPRPPHTTYARHESGLKEAPPPPISQSHLRKEGRYVKIAMAYGRENVGATTGVARQRCGAHTIESQKGRRTHTLSFLLSKDRQS